MPDETIVWKVGARVQRRSDVYDTSSPLRRGMVTARKFGEYDRRYVYTVQWDGDLEPTTGYFWWGLQPEEPVKEKT